ncbi:MAG TPA: glycosyltransferase [Gemmatimonadales bacterium]|nr:glycosyltransferase [Gemmatimonadales bacterium]
MKKPSESRHYRVALYSHDTMGLGHMRRNVLLAQALQHSRLRAVVLMIAGAREASLVTATAGVDCVALPSLWKDGHGQYRPRHLDISLDHLLAVRSRTAAAALQAFAPDVLIVDNVPRGALRELDPALEALRANGRTRVVLGLRDVLDDPITLQGEWTRARNHDVVHRYYDAVWVYGDRAVYDAVREYGFGPDVANKVRYTGYLDQRVRTQFAERGREDPVALLGLSPGPLALCLVGSGQDGAQLAEAFAEAELPPDTNGVLVTGPSMPLDARRRVQRATAGRPGRRIVRFLSEPTRLVRRADHIVAMGGYNTICEVLSFRKPALIVPRVKPRSEQLIRAERLKALGLVDVLHPADLTPAALSEWIARGHPRPALAQRRVDLNGLTRVPQFLAELLATAPDAA